jgi:oxygen-independent coproporphyrinogen-3 oxidase
MGLRQINGISLKNERNFLAYQYFKDKLKYTHIKNNYLIANNINLLNETLINLL